jgi:hypothetical protein
MADRLAVSWRGQEYEVVRRDGREAMPEPGPVWQVTRDGAPVTSFPAEEQDRPDAVREKVLDWLRANESRPELDVGRQ